VQRQAIRSAALCALALDDRRPCRQCHFTPHARILGDHVGVRRASVSEAADALQTMGAINLPPRAVTIVNRKLLNTTACECYEACKDAFAVALQV